MFLKDNTRPLRYAELFAGAGGMSLGIERAGWECAFHAEWDDVPRAILAARWPNVPLYGDVSELQGAELVAKHGAIDLLTGGSPCQDLSVAGKRAGLDGSRSVLFYQQMRLWEETGAPMCLWENVPGALNSNEGDDFAAILSAFVGAPVTVPVKRNGKRGKWTRSGYVAGPAGVAAWRVLDAQFFGVAQRRRRVFVLGVRGGVVCPREVLALLEGSTRHSAKSRKAGQAAAAATGDRVAADRTALAFYSTGGSHGLNESTELSPPLKVGSALGIASPPAVVLIDPKAYVYDARGNGDGATAPTITGDHNRRVTDYTAIAFNTKQDGADASPVCPTLLAMGHAESHANGGGQIGVVAFDTTQITHPANGSNPQIGDPCHPLARSGHPPTIVKCATGDVTHTLTHEGADASEDGTGRGTPIVARMLAFGHYAVDGTCSALKARDYKDATDLVVDVASETGAGWWSADGTAAPLRANPGGMPSHVVYEAFRSLISRPRRLTPRECERLQGWPDDHTLVQLPNGKWTSDAARYKACGNGVASVVADWVATQLGEALVRSGYALGEAPVASQEAA